MSTCARVIAAVPRQSLPTDGAAVHGSMVSTQSSWLAGECRQAQGRRPRQHRTQKHAERELRSDVPVRGPQVRFGLRRPALIHRKQHPTFSSVQAASQALQEGLHQAGGHCGGGRQTRVADS